VERRSIRTRPSPSLLPRAAGRPRRAR